MSRLQVAGSHHCNVPKFDAFKLDKLRMKMMTTGMKKNRVTNTAAGDRKA